MKTCYAISFDLFFHVESFPFVLRFSEYVNAYVNINFIDIRTYIRRSCGSPLYNPKKKMKNIS